MRARFVLVPVASVVAVAASAGVVAPAFAMVYLSIEQAQALMFPNAALVPDFRTLTRDEVRAIEKASGVNVLTRDLKVWRASTGGWFIADQVVGKHEFIPFALALDRNGAVMGVEIMDYRESYGYEIRNPEWRGQFVGKRAGDKFKLDDDIKNISGATLSCRHITDGVKRLLATYVIVLAPSGR
jgi:Na+-translocating ferredoxin:NAD+ oxidoreductase RnfG subunit